MTEPGEAVVADADETGNAVSDAVAQDIGGAAEPAHDNGHLSKWSGFMTDCGTLAGRVNPYLHAGRLTRINGLVMEAAGLKLPLGSGCRIMVPGGNSCEAEVVGFNGDKLFMMPTDDVVGLAPARRSYHSKPVRRVRRRPKGWNRDVVRQTGPSTCRSATRCSVAWSMAPAGRSTVLAPS